MQDRSRWDLDFLGVIELVDNELIGVRVDDPHGVIPAGHVNLVAITVERDPMRELARGEAADESVRGAVEDSHGPIGGELKRHRIEHIDVIVIGGDDDSDRPRNGGDRDRLASPN